jgi:tRNA threonylcarbamoyl adenosine modification protein (Sua5/YciO/YrdC/YwlC family)
MLIHIHPDNPPARLIQQVADCLRGGGLIIYPTDTIYGIGCDIYQPKAIEKLCQLKGVQPSKAQFSFICRDLSHLSDYTKSINTPLYRTLKAHLPGPFTFILPASKNIPKLLETKRSTVGIRVPDNRICQAILSELGHPIISASLPGKEVEEYTDPEIIHELLGKQVDMVIDGGPGGITPSTVVDCSGEGCEVIREGAGIFEP